MCIGERIHETESIYTYALINISTIFISPYTGDRIIQSSTKTIIYQLVPQMQREAQGAGVGDKAFVRSNNKFPVVHMKIIEHLFVGVLTAFDL